MLAFVRFLEDNVCYVVPVSCVQDFRPLTLTDFDDQQIYDVFRGPKVDESNGKEQTGPNLQRAQILALADNKSELEINVLRKKIKIPKLSGGSHEDSMRDHHVEDKVKLKHSKRLDGKKVTENAHKSIEAVVARLEQQNGLTQTQNSSCNEDIIAPSDIISADHMNSATIPRALYEELLRNYTAQQENMRRIQVDLERTRRQLVQQAKKLREYWTLVSEVKELRDLNRRLQDVLLQRLGSVPSSDLAPHGMFLQEDFDSALEEQINPCRRNRAEEGVCAQPIKLHLSSNPTGRISGSSDDPALELERVRSECHSSRLELSTTFSEEANTSTYCPPVPFATFPVTDKYILRNGKVHLGNGIWVDEEKWHQLQTTPGDSKFTKNLAVMIWGIDVLKTRSVTGVATIKRKDAVPKPPLSPHKLSLIRECVYDRITQETVDETEIAQRLSKVNKYICEKIMDINKCRKK
ncbi:BEN domain-containing protein 5 [Lissotriton helveticus]